MKCFNIEDKDYIKKIADKFINIGVLIVDSNNIIEYVNDYFCNLLNIDKNDLLNKNSNILKSGYHDDYYYENLYSEISVGNVFNSIIVDKSVNGNNVYLNITIHPIKHNDLILGYVAFYYDYTYYKHTENKLKTLLNSLVDTYIIILDKNYNIIEYYPDKTDKIYELILSDDSNYKNHISKLDLIKNNRNAKEYEEYYIADGDELRIFGITYNSFNYNKFILIITELSDRKMSQLQKIYINNIEKLKETLSS